MTSRPPAFALLALAAVLLSACTATPPAPTSSSFDDMFADKGDKQQLAECLTERGWDAEYVESDDGVGAVSTEVSEEQNAAYEADLAACWEEIGVGGELTSEDYDTAYQWYSEISSCLESAGWSVPEKPTRQTFESEINSDPWIPWSEVPPEDLDQAREKCPVLAQNQSQ